MATFDPYAAIVEMLRQQYQEQFDYQQALAEQTQTAQFAGQSAQEQAAEAAARAAGDQAAAQIQATQGNQTAGRQAGIMETQGARTFGLTTGELGGTYQAALQQLADQADIALRTIYTPQIQRGVQNSGISLTGLSDLTNKAGFAQDEAGRAYSEATARAAAALQAVHEGAGDLTATAQETGAANVAAAGARGNAAAGALSATAAGIAGRANQNLGLWDRLAQERLKFNQAQRQYGFDANVASSYGSAIGDMYAY